MYGPEYLDWVAECEAAEALDAFLAGFEPDDRRWVLAVLRKRHREVVYRDGPAPGLSQLGLQNSLQAALAQQQTNQSHRQGGGGFGGAFGGLFG